MTNLDERIFSAFAVGATSSGVADLIAEVEAAVIAAGQEAEAARTRALDPALSAADVAAARHEMESSFFNRDRMYEAVRRLGERLGEVKQQEEAARRRVAYDAALVERDKLAAELAEVYPSLAEKLADLAARVAANDAAIERVNQKLPDGKKWLANAELMARQLKSFFDGTADIPRIAKHMRLPAFKYAGLAPYTWPLARR
jgi:chromosome segregation ATPase